MRRLIARRDRTWLARHLEPPGPITLGPLPAHSRQRRAYIRAKNGGEIKIKDYVAPDPDELVRRKLVRRSHFMAVIAAWVVTVPASALLAAILFYAMSHIR